MATIEDTFRISGIPTLTFVEPQRYRDILVSVRTPGRCIVIEGPSGIGKTTIVNKVITELGLNSRVTFLSARRKSDLEFIENLPELGDSGIVVVDDFHRLNEKIKAEIADYMKVLADEEDSETKLIVLGINRAGQQLISFANDLGLRLDVFKLESNANELIEQIATKGEEHLNIRLPQKQELAVRSMGSFQLMQLLCYKTCILDQITSTLDEARDAKTSVNVAVEEVLAELKRQFHQAATAFATGSKLRREGRAPYLHLLKWLSESDDWSLDIREVLRTHPDMKGSVGQVVDKGFLKDLISKVDGNFSLSDFFYFQPDSQVLSVEDPKLVFYLRNLVWRAFTEQVGYRGDFFEGRYDFALSFAGTDRVLAERIFSILSEREVSVFYDYSEQHRIISQNVEDYLAPIYRSEARYIVPILSKDYPNRIWTKFESDHFRERFGKNEVIPIRFRNVQSGFFGDDARYGGLPYDPEDEMERQAQSICEELCKRLIHDKDAKRLTN